MNRFVRSFLAIMVASSFFVGCSDFQPAQDYVVTGTLTVPKDLMGRVNEYVQRGLPFELVMTARSGPKTSDILIQRRWAHVEMPFEFGLGKGRADVFRKQADGVFVTALLTCKSPNFPLTACGFTAKKVPIGTYNIKLSLDADPDDDATYLKPGAPVGGWSSLSVIEEAAPPSKDDKPLGAMAFAGEIEVPADLNRSFRDWKLRIIAREREGRGAPELILDVPNPTFPLAFSLHQNHRLMGGTEPILDPKFVLVFLDKDGVTETAEDRIVVGTKEQIEVGTSDLVFKFPERELREKLQNGGGVGDSAQPSTSRPSSQPSKVSANKKGALVAEGVIKLPPELVSEATGATLWISIRDAVSNKPLLFHRAKTLTFPYEFSISNGDGDMGMTVPGGSVIVVKAILSKSGDPMEKTALVGFSKKAPMGVKGVAITLAQPK